MNRFISCLPNRLAQIPVHLFGCRMGRMLAALMFIGCLGAVDLSAQENVEFQMPTDPSVWLNSTPITSELLEGKGAVLYFFEETSAQCAASWPALLAVADKYQGKPIVFIAINSGTPTSAVASYLRQYNVPWPTIVDSTRQFELAAGVGEISNQNILNYIVLNADGTLSQGRSLDDAAKRALATAAWNVDPETIPDALQECWQAVEFGNYASASRTLQKSLNSKKPEIQTAAATLNDFVQRKLNETLEKATSAKAAGDDWLAYKAFGELQDRFKGYEIETDVSAELETLAESEAVEAQLAAGKQLTSALKTASRSGLDRVTKRLEKLIENYPGTEAAQKAQSLLDFGG